MLGEGAGADFAGGAADVQEAQILRLARRWLRVLRAAFAVLVLLVWLAFLEDASHERRLTLAAVAERDANLAVAVELYAVRVLRTARAVHRLMGGLLVEGRSEPELTAMLADRRQANDVFRELGMCLPGGRVLPADKPGAHLTPALCEQVLAGVRAGPDVTVLPAVGPPGAPLLPLALAVVDSGGTRRAVAVALTPAATMLGIMQSAVLRDDTAVLLAGADGLPRAAWRSSTGPVTDAQGFAELADLHGSGRGTATIAHRPYLVSSRAMPAAHLRIHVATASDDALAAFHRRRARLLAVCLLVTIGLAAVYRLLARMHAEGVARSRALSRTRADLEALNGALDRQVQERTSQLEQAYRDLETFSFAVAHDVRAPLASIAGFAQALEPALAGADDKPRHYLRRIQANAAQMDELTRRLLELGRLTRAPLVRRKVDLSALAQDIVVRLREADPDRQAEVAIAPGLSVEGDQTLLRQVLENLLANAWKFTTGRARAHISVAQAPGLAAGEKVFVVEDDGAGFDSSHATGLFQPFRRMHGSDEFPGTGVGLAAVQRIVALHGGRVWCESRPGAGARFFFALPDGEPGSPGPRSEPVHQP